MRNAAKKAAGKTRDGDEYILDASALLALMLDEPGAETVLPLLDKAYIHGVNLAEVLGMLIREGVPPEEAAAAAQELQLGIEESFGLPEAAAVGELLGRTRHLGLSLGDCVCLAIGTRRGSTCVTAEQRWQAMQGARLGAGTIAVLLIR